MSSPFIEGAKKLLDNLKKRKPKEAPPDSGDLSPQMKEDGPPFQVRYQAILNGERWATTRALQFAAICLLIVAGINFATSRVLSKRPVQQIVSEGDLREQVLSYFEADGVNSDDFMMFLLMVSNLRFQVSEDGAPYLPLLQGLIAQEIYESTAASISRNLGTIKSQGITQFLTITTVTNVDYDTTNKRWGATIVGNLNSTIKKTKSGTSLVMPPTPYRAQVIVEEIPKSKLNPYGFFILNPLEEHFGEEAVARFDRLMEERRAKLSGRKN